MTLPSTPKLLTSVLSFEPGEGGRRRLRRMCTGTGGVSVGMGDGGPPPAARVMAF